MEGSLTFGLIGVASAYDHIVDAPTAGLGRDKLGRLPRSSVNPVDHFQHVRRYVDEGLLDELLWHSVVGCGYSSGDGGFSICVSTEVDSLADDILVVAAFKERYEGILNGRFCTDYPLV